MIGHRPRDYLRSRAEREMTFSVRTERVSRPVYDEETLRATPSAVEVLYEGKARVWESSGASTINVGETDLDIQSTQISFPWDAPKFNKNDEVLVLDSTYDSEIIGKRFQIQSSAKAGDLRPTRRYAVTAVN